MSNAFARLPSGTSTMDFCNDSKVHYFRRSFLKENFFKTAPYPPTNTLKTSYNSTKCFEKNKIAKFNYVGKIMYSTEKPIV